MPFKWLYKYTQREYKLRLRELTNQNVISVCWRLGLRWYYTWHIIIPHASRPHSAASVLQAEGATPLFWWCGSKLHVLLEVFYGPLSTKFRRWNAAFFVHFLYWLCWTGFVFFQFFVCYISLKSCCYNFLILI